VPVEQHLFAKWLIEMFAHVHKQRRHSLGFNVSDVDGIRGQVQIVL